MRQALESLLQSIGVRVEAFGSAADFLRNPHAENGAACIVLDVRLPGVSGLDFQAELAKADLQIPIIFITGYGDPNDGARDEGGRGGTSDPAVPRSGSS